LIAAFQQVAKRRNQDIALEVSAERISIAERMAQLTELLCDRKGCRFEELFADTKTNYDLVVTFLALLEMAKMKVLLLSQFDRHAPLYLQYRADAPAAIDLSAVERDFAVQEPAVVEQRDSMIMPSGSHELVDPLSEDDYKEPN